MPADFDSEKKRAPRNRTLTLQPGEKQNLLRDATVVQPGALQEFRNGEILTREEIENRIILGDCCDVIPCLPSGFADVIFLDPPYNLHRNFHGLQFSITGEHEYIQYINTWFEPLLHTLKPGGSVYFCGDWRGSLAIQSVLTGHLKIMNRITWQREKGRGASKNWKNAHEDMWFAVKNEKEYYFNTEAVKLKRKVIAPYKQNHEPKDWEQTPSGNFRLTHPSNFWDDISVPYWSMPENTDHPTQKPEKLLAKIIMASCPPDGLVFDPFAGSGTTLVAAHKLGRRYTGIELNDDYCAWALKRLKLAGHNKEIQGLYEGVFWERNSRPR